MATDLPGPHVLRRMVDGYEVSRALHVAAALGVADLLGDGPKPVGELASATETHAPTLYRLLRSLASVGVFAEDADGHFELTPLAQYLRSDVPGSMRGWAVWLAQRSTWGMWGDLMHSVRTGQPAFPAVHGTGVWDYYAQHPEENTVFNAAMTGGSRAQVDAVVQAYDFSGIDTLVDVGGGQGAFLSAILTAYPAMRGVLFDQPHVVTGAPVVLGASGVADRCTIVGGSFFESVPADADAYILKWIVHDWDDPEAVTILRTCRRAIADTGRLLLVTRVLPPRNEPHPAKFTDLLFLVMYGGRERTAEELERLLAGGGFQLQRIIPVTEERGESVVEGIPI